MTQRQKLNTAVRVRKWQGVLSDLRVLRGWQLRSVACSYSHSRFSIPRRLAHFASAEGSHCRRALAALLDQLDLGHETALQNVRLLVPDAPLDIVGPLQADRDIITTRHTAQRPRYELHHRGVVLQFPDTVKDFSLLESVEKNTGAQTDSSQ